MEIVYFELDDAVRALKRRQMNHRLVEAVNRYVVQLPPGLEDVCVVYAQALLPATTRVQDVLFMSQYTGIPALFPTYPDDKFVRENGDKLMLLKPHLQDKRIEIADPNAWYGNPISRIKTYADASLRAVHQEARRVAGITASTKDWSGWLQNWGGARRYYFAFLALFVTRAILVENYGQNTRSGRGDGHEWKQFLGDIFAPAYESVCRDFEPPLFVRPLSPNQYLPETEAVFRLHERQQ